VRSLRPKVAGLQVEESRIWRPKVSFSRLELDVDFEIGRRWQSEKFALRDWYERKRIRQACREGPAKAHRFSRGNQAGVAMLGFFDLIFVLLVFVRTLFLASVRQSFQFKLFGCKRLRHLHRTIDVSAEIWNHAIALHRRYYRLFKKTLPKAKLQAHLAKLRNGNKSHWKVLGSQSVQAITDRLYLGWEAFFRGDIKRPPTFRKRR